MNKSVTKYIFPYSSFHAEYDGDKYFHVQQFLQKLEGLLQPHVSLFIFPPILYYHNIYSVLWSKTEYKKNGLELSRKLFRVKEINWLCRFVP